MRRSRWSTAAGTVLAVTAALGLAACDDDDAAEDASQSGDFTVVPGVEYRIFEHDVADGSAEVHLLTVDLTAPGVGMDVLNRGHVTDTQRPSEMAEESGAVAAVNGDFFNNGDDDQIGAPTNAPIGPAIAGGRDLKGAVPDDHRQGPSRPESDEIEGFGDHPNVTADGLRDNRTIFGITAEGVAAVSELELRGTVTTEPRTLTLDGLNQHALPVDGIGLYTHEWGAAQLIRAVCGVDTDRDAPCSDSAMEFTVTDGTVTDVRRLSEGSVTVTEELEPGDVTIVARDAAMDSLRGITVGQSVTWDYELVSPDGTEFTAALGGSPLVLGGGPVGGLDDDTRAPRTAVGHSPDGNTVYMAVVDGNGDHDQGATMTELASIMIGAGAVAAVNLDGGGSSVMAAADEGGEKVTVRTDPTDPTGERMVANALAVFADPSAVPDDQNPPGGFAQLEGTWNVVATSPGQASTLTFDAEGNATYTSEGTIVDYWSGIVETEDGSVFTVDFAPSDGIYEEYGEDADPDDWAFTMNFELGPDGDSLAVSGEHGETEYLRAEG